MAILNHHAIVTNGFDEDALSTFKNGDIVQNFGALTTSGQLANGVFALANNVRISNFGQIATSGDGAQAIFAIGDGVNVDNHASIFTSGQPIVTDDAGDTLTADAIDVFGNGARVDNWGAIRTEGGSSSAVFTIGDNAVIRNFGALIGDGPASAVLGSVGDGNQITNLGPITVLQGDFTEALFVQGDNNSLTNKGNITISAGHFVEAFNSFGNNNSLTNRGDISISGTPYAVGMLLHDGVDSNATNSDDIAVSNVYGFGMGAGSGGVVAQGLELFNTGRIVTTGDYGVGMVNGAPRFDDVIPELPPGRHWAPTEQGLIANSGDIDTHGAGAVGILMASDHGRVVNSGRIETWGGVANYGPMGLTAASGIIATGDGVSITNSRTGWIETHDAASPAVQLNVIDGATPPNAGTSTFENQGTVRARAVAIAGGDGPEVVRNYGSIQGNVDLGAGQDIYVAGQGGRLNGVLTLGDGNDLLVVERASGLTRVGDFQAVGAAHDVIDVHPFFHDLASLDAAAVQTTGGVLITLDAHDSVFLAGDSLSSLHSYDFIFG